MLRISRLTDYGTVVLAHLASNQIDHPSAADVAAATGLGAIPFLFFRDMSRRWLGLSNARAS